MAKNGRKWPIFTNFHRFRPDFGPNRRNSRLKGSILTPDLGGPRPPQTPPLVGFDPPRGGLGGVENGHFSGVFGGVEKRRVLIFKTPKVVKNVKKRGC